MSMKSDSPPPQKLLSPLAEPPPAERILVVRLGAVGDVVRTRVAFAGIRALYPTARIEWLVEDRARRGLDGIVGLDDVVTVPRSKLSPVRAAPLLRQLVRELRSRRYDLAVDFHGILKSALLVRASGTSVRVGYGRGLAREWSHRFYTHRAVVEQTHLTRFARNDLLVRYLGGHTPESPPPLDLSAEVEREIDGAALPVSPVVIHPGTSEATLYKRWPADRYAAVARAIRETHAWPVVVTWGGVPGEREAAEAVVAAAEGAAVLAPPTPTVALLLALLRRARLFIGADSGPMHLAALAGRPLVVLYGPTDPLENAPFPGVPAQIVWHDVGCNPCREGCPARLCLDAIQVDEIVGAAGLVARASPVQ
jgi:ADP-heptose:LPS heptosyltransferase